MGVEAARAATPRAGAGAVIDQAGELRSSRIESLRAVAALGVLIGHAFVSTRVDADATFLDRLILGSGFGVFLFFTLSGYLLFWPFAKRDFGGGGRIDLKRYARNRALRILPLYFFVLVLLLVLQESGGSLRQWLVFTTFSQNFYEDTFGTVDGVMWSLVVELHFYALLPLLAVAIGGVARGSLRRAALALAAVGALSLVLRTLTVTLVDVPNVQIRYSILTLFFFFVSGMVLALLRIHMERDGARPPRGALGSSSAWIVAGIGVWVVVCWSYRLDSALALGGFLLVGACVLPLRPGRLLEVLGWRALAAIGVASYSLYLWHGPFTTFLYGGDLADNGFVEVMAVGGPLCLVLAFVSYRLVEAPFLHLRRLWSDSTTSSVSAAPASSSASEHGLVRNPVAAAGQQPASRPDG